MKNGYCRFCDTYLKHNFVNLGMSPLANSYIPTDKIYLGQMSFPLDVRVCAKCFLVQLGEFARPKDIFTDYAYFSSCSTSYLDHAREYANSMVKDYALGKESQIIEIASNDGYLLQYFAQMGISVLGIEPAQNVAKTAIQRGIPSLPEFFGTNLATKLRRAGKKADLLIGNNVLAHVPDINDFVCALRILLTEDGLITMEFPHLLRLIEDVQFDTIYHEHFSYLSFMTTQKIFLSHNLRIFDVKYLPVHGGSLRIFACHKDCTKYRQSPCIQNMLDQEREAGLDRLETYADFANKVRKIKFDFLSTLIELKKSGKHIVAYGAAAKGNTLLNYCGIGQDFIDYAADKNPHKQNTLLPGSLIPVYGPEKIIETKPDIILILPWNIKDEIINQLSFIRDFGAKFLIAIPQVQFF